VSRLDTHLRGFMEAAVEFTIRHVESGGLPFVGVLVGDDGYVSDHGVNLVQETADPSAHAEIVAMRAAIRDRGSSDLQGTSLLATGEPCGRCYRFAFDRGVDRVYIAVDADTVADWGFDYRHTYPTFGVDRSQLTGIAHRLPVARGLEPFERFLHNRRTPRV
jgi:guanine deaminase